MKTGLKSYCMLLAVFGALAIGGYSPGISSSQAHADDEKPDEKPAVTRTFVGKWNNRKYGTSGPLKCVMTETAPGQWKGTFTGLFQKDPFKYKATFQSKIVKRQLNVGGTAKVRGHDYQWTGTIKNGQLAARYKSSVGYYGEFLMKETKK